MGLVLGTWDIVSLVVDRILILGLLVCDYSINIILLVLTSLYIINIMMELTSELIRLQHHEILSLNGTGLYITTGQSSYIIFYD